MVIRTPPCVLTLLSGVSSKIVVAVDIKWYYQLVESSMHQGPLFGFIGWYGHAGHNGENCVDNQVKWNYLLRRVKIPDDVTVDDE